MFKKARFKLTAWYLAIIMAISLSFSVAIYIGVNTELQRIDSFQRVRQTRSDQINVFLRTNGLPVPPDTPPYDSETVESARARILAVLGFINLSILILAGAGGYFLAGQTLDPISKMVNEQKEFVGNASHELRTPLTSLMTEIEVALRDKKVTITDAKKLLKSNLEDVKNMSKLSNYLLKLSRYDRGANALDFRKVDLRDVVKEAVERKKVKTTLSKSVVHGNKEALVELVTILVDNAIKYSPKGKKIEIKTKPGGELEVEDHGIGISKNELPHIFDRFYRSDKSRGRDGYGLGLAIAKSIVDAHGGRISVESKLGHGSKFAVIIG